jgi:hypothetical protein
VRPPVLADAPVNLREDARRILEAGTDGWRPGNVTDRNFLDAAVGYLNQHSSHIAEIVTDQWNLVEVVRRRYNPETKGFGAILLLRIQCDRVEDGVARAVQIIAARGPTVDPGVASRSRRPGRPRRGPAPKGRFAPARIGSHARGMHAHFLGPAKVES